MTMRKFGLTALAIGLALSITTSVNAGGKPFGQKTDIEFGNLLWKTLENARLVGVNTFRMMPYVTPPPHGHVVEVYSGCRSW